MKVCSVIAKESFNVPKADGAPDSAYTKGTKYQCVLRGDGSAVIQDDAKGATSMHVLDAKKLFEIRED